MELSTLLAPWLWWLLIAVGLFILEVITPGFLLACFGIGALGAALPAAVGLGAAWQFGAFALTAGLSLGLLRPWMQRHLDSKSPIATGVDALIGRQARVHAQTASQEWQEITLDGDVWRIRSLEGAPLEAGSMVEVVGYESLILIVRPV